MLQNYTKFHSTPHKEGEKKQQQKGKRSQKKGKGGGGEIKRGIITKKRDRTTW